MSHPSFSYGTGFPSPVSQQEETWVEPERSAAAVLQSRAVRNRALAKESYERKKQKKQRMMPVHVSVSKPALRSTRLIGVLPQVNMITTPGGYQVNKLGPAPTPSFQVSPDQTAHVAQLKQHVDCLSAELRLCQARRYEFEQFAVPILNWCANAMATSAPSAPTSSPRPPSPGVPPGPVERNIIAYVDSNLPPWASSGPATSSATPSKPGELSRTTSLDDLGPLSDIGSSVDSEIDEDTLELLCRSPSP